MRKIFIILVIVITYFFISNNTLNNTREKANKIIQNIELYKQENRQYPEKLEKLIPIYYKKIPIHYSSIKYNFYYSYYKENEDEEDYEYYEDEIHNDNYQLCYFYLAPYYKYCYNSMEKNWKEVK